jgi:hypothetical protein
MIHDNRLNNEEKLEFILRNGWFLYSDGPKGKTYDRYEWRDKARQWTGHPDHNPYHYCNCDLQTAYEIEMELEYDRVTTLLAKAYGIIKNGGLDVVSVEFINQYKEWSKI